MQLKLSLKSEHFCKLGLFGKYLCSSLLQMLQMNVILRLQRFWNKRTRSVVKTLGTAVRIKYGSIAVFSDDTLAYHATILQDILYTDKRNMQRIECKRLAFCTKLKRLVRKIICYSKSLEMHTHPSLDCS
jgi:IS1 family transposase